MTRKAIYFILPAIVVVIVILIRPNNASKKMDPEIINKIKVISQANIYFGHKSVGQNIISGINKMISVTGQNELRITELNDNIEPGKKYFLHSNIWQNGDPKGKFKEFTKIVNDLENKKLNIAFMKLCFVDITENTDINDVFHSYETMVDSLKNKFPNLIIIHFTVPLKSEPNLISNIKDIIKGRVNNDSKDNLARNYYNELLLKKYSKEDIFDIAAIESTYPDGNRETISVNGKKCYALIKKYTNDGGHLNEYGQQIVAEKLINKIYEKIIVQASRSNNSLFSSALTK